MERIVRCDPSCYTGTYVLPKEPPVTSDRVFGVFGTYSGPVKVATPQSQQPDRIFGSHGHHDGSYLVIPPPKNPYPTMQVPDRIFGIGLGQKQNSVAGTVSGTSKPIPSGYNQSYSSMFEPAKVCVVPTSTFTEPVKVYGASIGTSAGSDAQLSCDQLLVAIQQNLELQRQFFEKMKIEEVAPST